MIEFFPPAKQHQIRSILAGHVDREVAANAATNRHDFLVALEHALKRRAATERARDAAQRPAEGDDGPSLRVVNPVQ